MSVTENDAHRRQWVLKSTALMAMARSMRANWGTPERVYIMKFAIEIGQTEKHRLEYHFNQLLGSLLIKINEVPVKQSLRLMNEPVLEVHVFVVGKYEQSQIRIEKERKPLLGHKNRLYVNNRLLKVFEGV